jgi:hypothetical protein
MDIDEIQIPEWIKEQCVAHQGQFVLRIFSVGDNIKCNAEIEYRVYHLTSVHDSLAAAITDLKIRMANASKIEAEIREPPVINWDILVFGK